MKHAMALCDCACRPMHKQCYYNTVCICIISFFITDTVQYELMVVEEQLESTAELSHCLMRHEGHTLRQHGVRQASQVGKGKK